MKSPNKILSFENICAESMFRSSVTVFKINAKSTWSFSSNNQSLNTRIISWTHNRMNEVSSGSVFWVASDKPWNTLDRSRRLKMKFYFLGTGRNILIICLYFSTVHFIILGNFLQNEFVVFGLKPVNG